MWWAALPLAALPAAAPAAQPDPPPPVESPGDAVIEFSADQIVYDSDTDIVSATGQVRMSRDGNYLAADKVTWNRITGQVLAEGNVVVVNPQGDKLVSDSVALTDTMREGVVDNLLVVLESGGRIAAQRGSRSGDIVTLENAAYSPCPVTTESGCPKRPSWMITAGRVEMPADWRCSISALRGIGAVSGST